ncbi:hypothetical protein A5679_17410 [Mycobacterium scrofulaceum]|uniref:Phage capsid-like C-terminal domain-containing protein n=2 Tax=Mycobacterium scrofulaceum TaxID=1783 RepID=A0A1A2VQK9_MYCSC|nr:hypothetical protein A5679_17410 [Mycobacterium scrofulaceum]
MTPELALRMVQTQADIQRLADRRAGDLSAQQADLAEGVVSGRYRTEPGSPGRDEHDAYTRDRTGLRGQAMRAVDRHVKAGRLHERGAETIEHVIGSGNPWAARWAAVTGDEHYGSAFCKWLSGPQGHLRWTAQEAEAFRRVEALRDEMRALGIGDSGSGGSAMVPTFLDPSILLSSAGSTSSLRAIARVETIATNAWNGVSSAGVTAHWYDEFEEVSDDSPTLTAPNVPVHRGSAFVPYSFEVEQDALNLIPELQRILLDAALQLSDASYTTGSGTGEPKGFVTAIGAVADSRVSPTTAETLKSDDVYAVQNALPPRFQANARWAANLSVLNLLRQMETTNGALLFPSLQDSPPTLLGRPAHEQSNMLSSWDPSATSAHNYVLAYGDWRQFLIVDRIGATFERVDHLFGTNRRPTGERGGLLWWRTGSDVLVPNAFRLLDIPTAA